MEKFFNPGSVAVVGASPRRGGHQLLVNIRYGFRGSIYPANPNYSEVDGVPCFSSLEEIPGPVDLAIIFVPAGMVPPVLEQCARKGISRVMIESAGFAETGDEGRKIQERCVAIARENGIRIWGPNCMGLVDVPRKWFFTFMSSRIYRAALIPGRVSLIVQSGMLSAAFLADMMGRRGIGIGKVCSIGNKADVDECDLLGYLLEDPGTEAVALYLESMRRGRFFAKIACRSKKPIVLLEGGKSEAGSRAALSHTYSLSGNSRLSGSVLRALGVTLAEDFHQMVDLATTLSAYPMLGKSCQVAVLTFSGGAGILSCDLLERGGVGIADLSKASRKALTGIFPSWMPVSNPVDIYPAMELHGRDEAYERVLSVLLKDRHVDAVLIHYVAGLGEDAIDLEAWKASADQAGKALVFWLLGPREEVREFRSRAEKCRIPVFGEISRAAECLSAASAFGSRKPDTAFLNWDQKEVQRNVSISPSQGGGTERIWDEVETKKWLSRHGIPVVEEQGISSMSEAEECAGKFGFPLVLKGLLPGDLHKTEHGLVLLGIADMGGLKSAYMELEKKMEGRGRMVLQRYVKADYELMIGYLRDERFGPCVMFGAGGVFSELRPDVAFALAPLNHREARALMGRVESSALLEGLRGMAPIRKDAMAHMLVRLGELGSERPEIRQVDVNPVAVSKGLPMALDANMVWSE